MSRLQQIVKLCAAILLISHCADASGNPPDTIVDQTWDRLSAFEGSSTSVTGDFDCQGMSIGVAQWNLGKSFEAVQRIVRSVPVERITKAMPVHGAQFVGSLAAGKDAAMQFVRGLHTYGDVTTCDSNLRKARWSEDGRGFRNEMKALLASPEALKEQRDLRRSVFMSGWANAMRWSKSARGASSSPTSEEILLFVDMAIFNGGGFEKFGLSRRSINANKLDQLCGQALNYMSAANEEFLLHKIAAKRNSSLLNCSHIGENEKILFALSHRLALKLNAAHSRQFRLTVLNRRAAILFGRAYYADRDPSPVIIPKIDKQPAMTERR